MNNARGGYFRKVPNDYPEDAYFTYDDKSCDYECQITEYFYWETVTFHDTGGPDVLLTGNDLVKYKASGDSSHTIHCQRGRRGSL